MRFQRIHDMGERNSTKTNTGVWSFLGAHVWFLLYALGWVTLALVFVLYVQHQPFRIGYRQPFESSPPLHQVEVSFAISAADAIIKTSYSSWCVIVTWRIIYILFSTRGTNLDELS